MENRFYGIATIILATIIYFFAFKKYKIRNHEYSLYLIILGGLLLRVFTSCDFYLHDWDEKFHALVAKNIIENPFQPMLYKNPLLEFDYRNWTHNHIWVHKQPFPIYTMAASMWLFGTNVIALRIPSIIFSTLGIFSTYKIGQYLDSKRVGLIAAFLFSINGLIIELSAGRVATDHIDVFFFSLISLAVYFLFKNVNKNQFLALILGALCTGLAILTKWLPALIVLPLWIIYSKNKFHFKKIIINTLIFIFIVCAVVLPWQIYILYNFPNEAIFEYNYNKMHLTQALGAHGKPFYFHLNRMRIIFGELIYLPLIWLIYTNFKLKNNPVCSILLTWIFIPYLFFSIAVTKMQAYILFTAPAIFIMTALFFDKIQSQKVKFYLVIKFISILLIALPIRYSLERIKPFSIRDRSPIWITELRNLEKENPQKKKVIFNSHDPISTMFYSDFNAYSTVPSVNQLREIHLKGYSVFINYSEKLTSEIKKLNFIKLIEIKKRPINSQHNNF